MRFYCTIFFFIFFSKVYAQTLGGNAAYNFLKFPYGTALTATGGVNISNQTSDVSFALNNPALLNASLHAQTGLNFTQLPAGIKAYNLAGAYHDEKRNSTFGASVFFINYGQIQATDASGNREGQFGITDFVVQVSAGRSYLERWHYGGSLKFIQSSYQIYRSSAIAFDFGVQYVDSANGVSIAVLAKNLGVQLKSYTGEREELPFDLQVGITKKLAKAPLAFSATLQQLHRFNLLYNDTTFNAENNISRSTSIPNRVLQHFIFAAHVFITKQVEATVGYNHLRKTDLGAGTTGSGLAGFSAGFAARFEKLHISFARSSYQLGIAYNQLGLNLMLNKLSGAGKF